MAVNSTATPSTVEHASAAAEIVRRRDFGCRVARLPGGGQQRRRRYAGCAGSRNQPAGRAASPPFGVTPMAVRPARAQSSSCSSFSAPLTPHAPSRTPPRMIGNPPGRRMNGAPSPTTVAVRDENSRSTSASPLGPPVVADAIAFPMEPWFASSIAPSMRLAAMRRPSESHTVTLTSALISRALARAAAIIWVASASFSVMQYLSVYAPSAGGVALNCRDARPLAGADEIRRGFPSS